METHQEAVANGNDRCHHSNYSRQSIERSSFPEVDVHLYHYECHHDDNHGRQTKYQSS